LTERSKAHKLFINGEWVEGRGKSFTERSPVDGTVLAQIPIATEGEVKAAIDAASEASDGWRMKPRSERARIVAAAANQLAEIADPASEEVTMEMGKPIAVSRHELTLSRRLVEDAASQIRTLETSYIPCDDPGVRAVTMLEPYGVFAIIAPWNFPYLVPLTTLSYAIAAGNTVVFKPAEQTPLAGERIVQCFERAGVPKGVINLLQGTGEVTGEAITSSNKLDGVAFTGSIEVGKRIAAKQGGKLTHLVFELGGNGPIIVLDDADLSQAARSVAESCYGNSGQDCQAAERILVGDRVYGRFLNKVIAATKEWKVGDPRKAETKMGPLVEDSIASKVDRHISDALKKGAKIRSGGARAKGYPTDLYYESTVLQDVSPEMQIATEETFGPVCPLIRCGTMDEAVEIANSGDYGLASSVFTSDLRNAMVLSERIKTGEVVINYPSTFMDINVPFGGMRKSGIGRVNGKYGIMSFSQLKSVFLSLG
jgi:succinate-semialdehyde dehydrogenase/glutarate-semialdehyde dehydrogenase